MSTRRSSLIFGAAVILSNLSQGAWLVAGARALPGGRFGIVLTAQAVYGILQLVVDNGTGFHGARLAARGRLDPGARDEVVRARIVLALGCVLAGLLIAGIGGTSVVAAFAPFAAALCLFALLNVWEPYGSGRVLPYAAYLVLRSLVLAAVVGVAAIAGVGLPVGVAGVCEVATILITGTVFAAWKLPRRGPRVGALTWRAIFDIGVPGLITQYNSAIATVVLGVSGRTSAAAVSGVTFRLLSGLQGMNGAAVAALFPRLARSSAPQDRETTASRIAALGIVGLSFLALLGVAIAAPLLVRGFLNSSGGPEQAAVVLGMGGAPAAGLVLHQSFALVARGLERHLLRASAIGAAVITLVALAAASVGGSYSPAIAAAGFAVGQSVTLALLLRVPSAGRTHRRNELALAVAAGGLIPLLALGLVLAGGARIWIAGALVLASAAAAALAWEALMPGRRPPAHHEAS